MKLIVIKERWDANGQPMIDPQSGDARRQLVNGGVVQIIDPKSRKLTAKLPGEEFELPDDQAENLIRNAPQSVEPLANHLARVALRRQHIQSSDAERDALTARMAELQQGQEQAQKLRAMAEERERNLAAENAKAARTAVDAAGEMNDMRVQMAKIIADNEAARERDRAAQAKIAELEEKLNKAKSPESLPASAPSPSPALPPDTGRGRGRSNG